MSVILAILCLFVLTCQFTSAHLHTSSLSSHIIEENDDDYMESLVDGDEVAVLPDENHRQLRRRRKNDIASLLKHEENTDPHYVKTSHWWEVTHPYLNTFAAFNNQTMHLYLRRYDFDNSAIHSCYQYRLEEHRPDQNNTNVQENTFCYPAIIVTGVPKCSTSAVFQMLKGFDHSRSLLAKEVCPGAFSYANLHNLFDAFSYVANDGSLGRHDFIINACISLYQNLIMYEILRQPKTFYIVVLRDYTNWMWSSYNYWCDRSENDCAHIGQWLNGEYHRRSPEHFHTLVSAERSNMSGLLAESLSAPIAILFHDHVCKYAEVAFRSYVQELWQKVGVENTLVFASEELERDPAAIVQKLSQAIGFSHLHFNIESFQSVRYNTNKKAGENNLEAASEYRPGLYNISGYRPMLDETRVFLDRCWQKDCAWVSLVTGYPYKCASSTGASLV